jgi:uncharacterized protein (TIGR02996 family)
LDDENAFMTAILSQPRDDMPRLVFADWLDERSGPEDPARAEFIRLSVAVPDTTFLQTGPDSERDAHGPECERASVLCRTHWNAWARQLSSRLGGSPFQRWIGKKDCWWGYRRGFASVFEGTQQVVLDAWDDLFRLGPIEDVRVTRLWHLGTVTSLSRFLDRPCLRFLQLHAEELRHDDVEKLTEASDWLARLERVELFVHNPDRDALQQLRAWLASSVSTQHIYWGNAPVR